MEPLDLYESMLWARAFEVTVAGLWTEGRISGEMHLGTGEEAVAAGVCAHLQPDDALALDHRATPFLLLRGVDPVAMLKEMLGDPAGLCRGRGGHMHLMSPEHRAAASGIVGSAAPLAVGFALSGATLRRRSLAVATFGDGALNQGMLLEALNLAAVWNLPVLFVCKDNRWAITTRSAAVTAGAIADRVRGFGIEYAEVEGLDPVQVHAVAERLVRRIRRGRGPAFLLARCSRLDGHFLGDPAVKTANHPVREGRETLARALGAALSPRGGGPLARARGMAHMVRFLGSVRGVKREGREDPLVVARARLDVPADALDEMTEAVAARAADVLATATEGA